MLFALFLQTLNFMLLSIHEGVMSMEKEEMPNENNTDIQSELESSPEDEMSEENLQKELLKQVVELKNQINDLKAEISKGKSDETQDKPLNEPVQSPPAKKRKKKWSWLGELVFYAVLIVLVGGAFFIRSNADGRPTLIAGFSAFVVKTGSMQAEIPQGSLVITKQVDPKSLQVGDDITFMVNQTATITHRIIGITEDFNGTGQRAFETQGIMNKEPDKNLVPAVNVVGKVVFHSKVIGKMAIFVGKNWPIMLYAAVVIGGMFVVLKRVMKDDGKQSPKKLDSQKQHENSTPKDEG